MSVIRFAQHHVVRISHNDRDSSPQAWSVEGTPGSPSPNTLRSLSPAFWLYTPGSHSPANHGLHLSLAWNAFIVWSRQCGYKKCHAPILLLWIAHLYIHPVDLFSCVFSSALLNCLSTPSIWCLFHPCDILMFPFASAIETVTVWVKSLPWLRCSIPHLYCQFSHCFQCN